MSAFTRIILLILVIGPCAWASAEASGLTEKLASADSLVKAGNVDSALTIARSALAEVELNHNEHDTTIAKVMAFMGALWQNDGGLDTDSSATMLRAALDKVEKAVGRNCALCADIASKLAQLLGHLGNFEESEKLFRQAIDTRVKLFGINNVDVAKAKFDFAYMYTSQGSYPEAESLYLDALGSLDRSNKPDRQLVLLGHYLLAQLYSETRRNSEALELLESGLPEARVTRDKYLESLYLDGLSTVSQYSGQLQAANEYAQESLDLSRELWGEVHPDVAVSLINLANLSNQMGQYSRAEKYARQGLDTWDKLLGHDQGEEWIQSMNILASILQNQSRLSEAESTYNQTLRLAESKFGETHPLVTEALNGLATTYSRQRDFDKASTALKRLIQLDSLIYGPEHVLVAGDINHLSSISFEQGDYDRADSLESMALGLISAESATRRHLFAEGLLNLAIIRTANGKLADADSLFQQSLSILMEIMGSEHPRVTHCLSAYSSLKLKLGDVEEARRLGVAAFDAAYKHFQNNADILREEDALSFAERLRSLADLSLSRFLTSENPSLSRVAAAIALSVKGVVSDGVAARVTAQRELQVVSASQTMRQFQALRSELSERLTAGPQRDETSYREGIDSLAKVVDSLDSWLALHNANYPPRRGKTLIDPMQIAGRLSKGGVLVEYLRWQTCESSWSPSIPRYMALVLHPDSTLSLYDLGDANAIDTLVAQYRLHMASVSAENHLPDRSQLEKFRNISSELYRLLLQPLRAEIGKGDQILLAPDAALNLVSFAGLIDSSGKYLIESHPIHYLSAGRDLIRLQNPPPVSQGLLALGDPDYDASISQRQSLPESSQRAVAAVRPSSMMYNQRSVCDKLSELKVDQLPSTRTEVTEIVNSWKSATGQQSVYYVGPLATEDRFKAECSGKQVIHLATHGFFLGGECKPANQRRNSLGEEEFVGENPLLLSGLLLAGANLHGQDADSLGIDDGILTAEEVSSLNLEGTKLVVLSACETGLGKVEQGEGVYGLRRAFLMAGARTVISSLWQVDDQTTAEMMKELYRQTTEPIPVRMRNMQLAQIKKLRDEGLPDHPYLWGAFIATGDWR